VFFPFLFKFVWLFFLKKEEQKLPAITAALFAAWDLSLLAV
jgi:hypothetical protein